MVRRDTYPKAPHLGPFQDQLRPLFATQVEIEAPEMEYSQSSERLYPTSEVILRPRLERRALPSSQLLEQSLADPVLQWMNQPDTTQVSSPHFPAMETEAGTKNEVAGCGWIPGMFAQGHKAGLLACGVRFQGVRGQPCPVWQGLGNRGQKPNRICL